MELGIYVITSLESNVVDIEYILHEYSNEYSQWLYTLKYLVYD